MPRQFTGATFQMMYEHRKQDFMRVFRRNIGCVVADECHVVGSPTYNAVMMMVPAYYRIGMSATPSGRSDKLDALVVAATGGVIYRKGIQDLSHGPDAKLAKAKIAFYAYPNDTQLDDELDWNDEYVQGIVKNDARNAAIVRVCQGTPKPVLVFFERLAHGYLLRKKLEQAGLEVDIVSGKDGIGKRTDSAKQLNAENIDVLLASRIFNKGWDIPMVRSCINAAGYKAEIISIQKLGRGLRRVPGEKEVVFFWDFWDRAHDLLTDHSRQRAEVYKDQGLPVKGFTKLKEALDWLELKVERLRFV
jgi:superfamily II DNA or RNA helicase